MLLFFLLRHTHVTPSWPRGRARRRPELDGVAALEQLGHEVAHRHLRQVEPAGEVGPAHGTGRVEGLEHERQVVPATVSGQDRSARVDASGRGAAVTMRVSKVYQLPV